MVKLPAHMRECRSRTSAAVLLAKGGMYERMRRMERKMEGQKREEIEGFLKKAGSFGIVPGLSNMEHLMEELGNPQEELSIVHIAGTNGKGSVGAMLDALLREAGFFVGRYSSPAVFSVEEQYQIDGKPIEEEERFRLLGQLSDACLRIEEKGLAHPTLFEVETAAAFLWFYQKKCQIVLLETGLGGRLDATNIIRKPLCSVITSVSMDHMKFLGNTLREIAGEKAGIIKAGCPVVTARQEPEALAVIKDVCKKKHSKLYDTEEVPANLRYEGETLVFDWNGYSHLELSLLGACQPENAVCALLTLDCLRESFLSGGTAFSKECIRRGLKGARWPGRFEIVSRKPLMVLDGAHNEDAAKKLRETLELGFTNRKIIYIIGVLADKEHDKMLRCLLPLAHSVYTVTPDSPRALSGEALCREASRYHQRVTCAPTLEKALVWALETARQTEESPKEKPEERAGRNTGSPGQEGKQPLILAFGSLSWLGGMKREMERIKKKEESGSDEL